MALILDSTDHFPGSTVQGTVMVSVDDPQDYRSIVVELWGRANVHWTERQRNGGCSRMVRSETFIYFQTTVWKVENSPTGELPVGEHYFPFSFQLPQNIPSSFEGAYGRVRYELEARVVHSDTVNSDTKSRHLVTASLRVRGGASASLYSYPKTAKKSKSLWSFCFKSGSVSATVRVPRTGFSPGESIPISLHLSNWSSRQIRMVSALKRKDTFIESGGRKKVVSSSVAKAVSHSIRSRGDSFCGAGNLMVPAEAQATMRTCSCIRLEYTLVVKLHISWSSSMEMKIPIVIANNESSRPAVLSSLQPLLSPAVLQERQLDSFLLSYDEAVGNV